jgi:hypothetical protein
MQSDERKLDVGGIAGAAAFTVFGIWILYETMSMSPMGSIFPRTIAIAMIVMSLALIALNVTGRYRAGASLESTAAEGTESTPRRLLLVAVMLAWVLLMAVIGFFVTSLLAFFAIMVAANYDGWTARRSLTYGIAAVVIVAAFYFLMVDVLLIPVPRGLLF